MQLAPQQLWALVLSTFWVLSTGAVIVTITPGAPLPRAFKDAVRLSAARGKLWSARPHSLGFLNDLAVPQRWFLHFYMVGSVTCVSILVSATRQPSHDAPGAAAESAHTDALLALALFTAHLFRRLLETWLIMVYPPGARMHVIAYAFGLAYYVVAPLSLMPDDALALQQPLRLAPGGGAWWHTRQLSGAGIMLAGFVLQSHTHVLLARLARGATSSAQPGEDDKAAGGKERYVIPTGGLFPWVSCPHYLGEVIIYAGLAVLCWPAPRPLLMLLWVVVNLVLAAQATHRWYHDHFPGRYPACRRALIPYVF